MSLEIGTRVKYSPQSRPNLVCVSCERTSEDLDEANVLGGLDGATGCISRILDPKDAERVVKCRFCLATYPVTDHLRSLGIAVVLDNPAASGHIGIWAYPDELEEVPADEEVEAT